MGEWWQTVAALRAAEAWALEATRRDGRCETLGFPSLLAAELYLRLLPELQVAGDEEAVGIVTALLRPIGVGAN